MSNIGVDLQNDHTSFFDTFAFEYSITRVAGVVVNSQGLMFLCIMYGLFAKKEFSGLGWQSELHDLLSPIKTSS